MTALDVGPDGAGADGDDGATAVEVPRPEPFWIDRGFPVELVAALAYFVVRAWQSWGVQAMVFQDSLKNLESATFPLVSLDLWAGQRTPLVPFVMKLTGATQANVAPFLSAQVVIGALAFGLLAATVGRTMPGRWRWVGLTVVLLFGLTTPVTMWDHVVLTESLSVSTIVLVTVTGIWLLQRHTWPRLAMFLVAATLLVLVRDTHIVVTALVALGVGAVTAVHWRRSRTFPAMGVVVVVVLLVLTAFGRFSTVNGFRYIQPTRETLFVKILPYEDRFEWFAARGMPDADRLRELRVGIYPDAQTGTPLFPLPAYGDPAWEAFNTWVREDANSLYNRWLLTHPADALGDFFRKPKMIWNSAGDSWVFYRAAGFKEFRVVDVDLLLFPPLAVVTLVAGGAVALLASSGRRWWREPVGLSALVLLGTGVAHNLASYLGDPAEVSRHALGSIVQLRIGLLLLVLTALPELGRRVRSENHASPAQG